MCHPQITLSQQQFFVFCILFVHHGRGLEETNLTRFVNANASSRQLRKRPTSIKAAPGQNASTTATIWEHRSEKTSAVQENHHGREAAPSKRLSIEEAIIAVTTKQASDGEVYQVFICHSLLIYFIRNRLMPKRKPRSTRNRGARNARSDLLS